MPWPNIFFGAKKNRQERAPAFKSTTTKSSSGDALTPTTAIKPANPSPAAETRTEPPPSAENPALRPAVRASKSDTVTPPAAPISTEAEAVRAFARANSIRLNSKRPPIEPQSAQTGPILTTSKISTAQPVTAKETTLAPLAVSPASTPPVPSPETTAPAAEAPSDPVAAIPKSEPPTKETPSEPAADTPKAEPPLTPPVPEIAAKPPEPPAKPARRKARLIDLARMILSPSHEPETKSEPTPEPPSAVSPPAFTVQVPVGSVIQPETPVKPSETSVIEVAKEEKPPAPPQTKPVETPPVSDPTPQDSPETKHASTEPIVPAPESEKKAEQPPPEKTPETPTATSSGQAPIPFPESKPDASKSESTAPSVPVETTLAGAPEKKEFLLVNGERILGTVLSETPENIYLDHSTLGVLTLPRTQIAARPVEIILINGDRIVGDIMAETPDTLYVRHASLGMLTVPRSQRSTRVVEALLKGGDRILGEVLAETENFTVIRSATLGTVAVPHNKVDMLNRKIEQIALKPAPAPAIEDKPSK